MRRCRPGWTHGSWTGLAGRGIERLYTHQAEAIEAVHAGEDVVVVTPTASGKTLCYALPALQAIADDPSARALFLFPTKALGQDQVTEFGELSASAGLSIITSTYDGDTPAPIRSAIRAAGQVVVTNPDMLHSAILPHHTKWFQLFEQLQLIVIDELHTYRGVFGSHVANVLRRLLRICAHYGSHPVIVCCSATIGNPGELATMLTGRPARLVDRNGAPSGKRHVLLVDPPVMEPASGARSSAETLAQRWALPFLRAGRQTIVFGRSRVAVEILLTGLRESLRESYGPRSRVRGYRGGYLPTERRAVERGLRDGEILGVVATNALELGVDIGRLDASILAGYPGSVAATWQQFGRAGRRLGTSVAVLVASRRPGGPVRHPPPGVPPREHAGGGPARPGQPARPAGPPARRDVRAAVRARRGLRAGPGRRPPGVPGRGAPRPPGRRRALVLVQRELPGVGDLAADGGTGERRDHRHDAGPAARPRRGGPVQRPGPRPRAGHLHPRIGAVLRRPARVGRAQGLRPPRRRGPLHVREPGGDAQAAGGLRRGARHRRPADPRRGHGREPRHAVQEAQVPHRRERRVGSHRPPGAGAPDDGLLADRRGGPRPLAARRPRRRAARRRPGHPDHRRPSCSWAIRATSGS